MSNTHDIVCTQCKVRLWFGQTCKVGLQIYDYKDDKGQQHLARFLLEHKGCILVVEDEHSDSDPAVKYVKWPEILK